MSEGLILFEALQYHGVPSELLVFPDENHWILKPRNIIVWYRAVLEFIGRHISAAAASPPAPPTRTRATARAASPGRRRSGKA